MNKSELFKRAWAMAREAQASFGGSVKKYFGTCLSNAWSVFKKLVSATVKNGVATFQNGKTAKIKAEIELIDGMTVFGRKSFFLGRDLFIVFYVA